MPSRLIGRMPGSSILIDCWFNPSMARLKPQSNGPSYSNSVVSTLAVDGWAVTLVQRGGAFTLFDLALSLPLLSKGLNDWHVY